MAKSVPKNFNLKSLFRYVISFLRHGSNKKKVFKLLGTAVLILFFFSLAMFAYYSKDLPDPNRLNSRLVAESTKIYDRDGELLYDIFGETKRTLIDFEEMPQSIKDATVAIEDKDFYNHKGIDFSRIISSAVYDVVTLSKAQGASTITQQFIKNALLTNEKKWSRKIKEIVLAIQIERKFSKEEILKLYLNEAPYGANIYGIESASQSFFQKPAAELTLAESAYLAAIPQAPTLYSPYGPNRDRLDARKDTVLRFMKDQGYISEEEMGAAMEEGVVFSPVRDAILAPHFVLYIQNELVKKYGEKTLQEGGLQITTTLDLDLQVAAEEAIAERAETNANQWNAHNAALVSIDPKTGQVLAMVGSKNFFDEDIDGQVNVALRPRQPGSSFKPYIYATAFKEGYSPATMLMDVVTNFGEFGGEEYTPLNYNNKVFGPVSMRQALAGSLNIPAVKTILLVGVKNAIKTAQNMGISTLTDTSRYGPSLVLGGGEVKLLDHVSAYSVFANNGVRHEPVTILKITDNNGKVLEEYKEKSGQRVLDEQVAFLINSVLSDNNARSITFGQRNWLTLPGRPVAAKTGTTQEYRDAWTVGYTPQIATGVWVGNNDNSEMKPGAAGGTVAAPIWNSYMKKALTDKNAENFYRPEQIRDIAVDRVSGKLPTQNTFETKPEVFASFAEPSEFDDVHLTFKIDKNTQRPATDKTPKNDIVEQIYTVLHSQKPNEENWENPVTVWSLQNGYAYPGIEEGYHPLQQFELRLIEPKSGATITDFPLVITAKAKSKYGIKNIKVLFDDEEIFSGETDELSYFFSNPKPDGDHIIEIIAEDNDGETESVKRTVTYAFGKSLTVTKPQSGQVIFFPTTLEVQAHKSVSSVEFFYQKIGNDLPVRIAGETGNTPDSSGNFSIFSLTWQGNEQIEAGEYEIFSQSNTGERSERIKIIIP